MKKIIKLLLVSIFTLTAFLSFSSFSEISNQVNAAATLSDGQTLDTNVDVISISDLTFDGKTNQTELTGNKDTDVSFEGFDEANVNKNLIFIFKYDLQDNSVEDDSKRLRIHMDVSDSKSDKTCSMMIRPDKMFLWNTQTNNWQNHATLAEGKTYNVEFGRIAILNSEGAATGNYYVYYKIDGVEYDSAINTYNVAKMDNTMFIHIGTKHSAKNRILDAYGKEDPKYIDVSDLSSSPIALTANGGVADSVTTTFDNSDHKANYSLVFRFKYTFNDANRNKVHINGSTGGKASSFTLGNENGTKVSLGITKEDGSDDSWSNFNYKFSVGQTYDVEYGRVANVCGSYLLKTYECYLKINGEVVATVNCVLKSSCVSGNKVYFTAEPQATETNIFTDCAPIDVIETPDVISVSDLKLNGQLVGNTTVMDSSKSYTYDATATHKSLIYKAKFEVSELLTGATDYIKMNFGSSASKNAIRVRDDKTYIKKDDEKTYAEGPIAFPSVGTYEIEFGKVYITEGKHAGMYHLYVKSNGVMIDEYYTNNAFGNNYLFNNLKGATQTWTDICADGHTPGTKVAGVASTCSTHGTLEYYECEVCKKKFSDQACTQKLDSLDAPLAEHNVVDGECSKCHAKTVPEFVSSGDGTKITFTNPIQLWKYSSAKVSFDSSYSSVLIDFTSKDKTDRVSEKKSLEGTEVIGLTGIYYHYEFNVKDFACNDASGYETLEAFRFRDTANYANVTVTDDFKVLEVADEISVGDLSNLDGKAYGKIVTFDTAKKFKWESTASHSSVIFSFKYTINEIPTGEYSYGQFHFNEGYSSNSLWPKNDATYIKKDDGSRVSGSKVFTEAGTKKITYGKVYIKSGDLAGKYYLFVKVDGVTVVDYVTANDYDNNNMFCTLEDGTQWMDVNYVPNQYEIADEISIGDLYLNGKEMPNLITLDTEKEYTYTATSTYKSVVFKFKMTVDTIPEEKTYDYGQFYFDELWGNNCVWIRNDNTFIAKDNGEYVEGAKAFSEPGTKIIEIGKIYVTVGEDAGKYRLYVKADDVLLVEYFSSNELIDEKVSTTGIDKRVITTPNYVACEDTHTLRHYDAITPSCDAIGNIEYNWCKNCGKYYNADGSIEITDPSTIVLPMTHEFGNLVEGTPATCDEDGTYSYYECSLCHKKYKEDKTTILESVVELAHHNLTHFASTFVTCNKDGNVEYWYCSECDKYYLDEECTKQTTKEEVTIIAHHTLSELIKAITETCATDGNVAYYHCYECGKNFADKECTQEIENVIIVKHHSYVHVEGVEATCNKDGNVEYYECSVCHKVVDGNGNSLAEILIPKHEHSLSKIDAVLETCKENGNVEYYHCNNCNKNYSDEAGTNELAEIIIPKHAHTLNKIEAVAVTCDKDGNVAYYHCDECEKNFSDKAGTQEIENVIIAKHHSLKYVEGVEATCSENGIVAHYECLKCEKYFADEAGTNELKDVIILAKGHQYEDGKCQVCDEVDPNYQKKGCQSSISISCIISLIGLAALLFIRKKKETE